MQKKKYPMRDWFTLLEPEVRRSLIDRMERQDKLHRLEQLRPSLESALLGSMSWTATPEGPSYWARLRKDAVKNIREPRQGIDCTVPI